LRCAAALIGGERITIAAANTGAASPAQSTVSASRTCSCSAESLEAELHGAAVGHDRVAEEVAENAVEDCASREAGTAIRIDPPARCPRLSP
jgi:hypothetical protein